MDADRDPVTTLRRAFGYPGFREGQEELVRGVLEGRDALGVLPTGGGKSVCYQVPALMLPGLTLVVTPLVSLMEDQVLRAREIGLGAACLSGTQAPDERRRVSDAVQSGEVRILFVSPERLDVPTFRDLLEGVDVSLLAVDEAHCISEWGHDFRPAYRRIGRLRHSLRCPTLALTASATPAVRADILSNLGFERPLTVVRSFDRPNLWWAVRDGGSVASRLREIDRVVRAGSGVTIVYAPTRRSVETVRDHLAALGHRCDAYHAGLPGPERSSVQERFMAGESRVVVATNAFGMGIDKADVRLVVHLQLPTTLEAYYQEAGRAGRDGQPAACVAFHGRTDGRLGRGFIDRTHPKVRTLARLHRALQAASDQHGIASVDHPSIVRALGALPVEWMSGEPSGALGALERIGALRRLPEAPVGAGRGTGTPVAGSLNPGQRVGVRRRADFSSSRRLRRRSLTKLAAVRAFARTRGCRRGALLRYFGEDSPVGCGRCDGCGWNSESGIPVFDG